jgi:cystathionine beta-synthase
VDEVIQVSDIEAFGMSLALTRQEGIFAGGSSGAAVRGALKFARDNPGLSCIVAIMPDTGRGYLSKLYNETWRGSKGV